MATKLNIFTVTEPLLDAHCALGEAPYWEQARDCLRFVDIVKKEMHFLSNLSGPIAHRIVQVPYAISTTADIESNDDEFIGGDKLGFVLFNRDSGQTRRIARHWDDADRQPDGGGKPKVGKNLEERSRSNDGAVDSRGRYWCGTMNDQALVGSNFTDEGVLFRLDHDLTAHRAMEGVTIPNGMSWSADDTTMYFTDSPSQTVMAYPFNSDAGTIDTTAGRVLFRAEQGVPDGHCQDEEGCLWIANHGAGKVWRVTPAGERIACVNLPTRCVTAVAFCGTDLFITSMADVDPDNHPESLRYQGALFRINVGVAGKPPNKFKMSKKA